MDDLTDYEIGRVIARLSEAGFEASYEPGGCGRFRHFVAQTENPELGAKLIFGVIPTADDGLKVKLCVEDCAPFERKFFGAVDELPPVLKPKLRRWTYEKGPARIPQKSIAAWANLRWRAFLAAMQPQVGHEEMYGGGDESYELDFVT